MKNYFTPADSFNRVAKADFFRDVFRLIFILKLISYRECHTFADSDADFLHPKLSLTSGNRLYIEQPHFLSKYSLISKKRRHFSSMPGKTP